MLILITARQFEGADFYFNKRQGADSNTLQRRGRPMAPSFHSPHASLQVAGISQKGACAHVWLPGFCGCCARDAPCPPGSSGQQGPRIQWDGSKQRKGSKLLLQGSVQKDRTNTHLCLPLTGVFPHFKSCYLKVWLLISLYLSTE